MKLSLLRTSLPSFLTKPLTDSSSGPVNSKYTTFCLDRKEGKFQGIGANFVGNHKKSLRLSVSHILCLLYFLN